MVLTKKNNNILAISFTLTLYFFQYLLGSRVSSWWIVDENWFFWKENIYNMHIAHLYHTLNEYNNIQLSCLILLSMFITNKEKEKWKRIQHATSEMLKRQVFKKRVEPAASKLPRRLPDIRFNCKPWNSVDFARCNWHNGINRIV